MGIRCKLGNWIGLVLVLSTPAFADTVGPAGSCGGGNCAHTTTHLTTGTQTIARFNTNYDAIEAAVNDNFSRIQGLLNNPVFTGVVTLPRAATPSINAAGQLQIDIDAWAAGHDAITFWDGTARTRLLGVLESDTPSAGQVPKFNANGTITWENDNSSGTGSNVAFDINGVSKSTAITKVNVLDTSANGGPTAPWSGGAGVITEGAPDEVTINLTAMLDALTSHEGSIDGFLSGDVPVARAGGLNDGAYGDIVSVGAVVTISGNTISTSKIQNGAVTAAKVAADVATQAELDAATNTATLEGLLHVDNLLGATPLRVAKGGTGTASQTVGGVLFGNGTSGFTNSGVLTNGQLLIGDGSGVPTIGTLTGTAGEVDITNGAGTITIGVPTNPTFTGNAAVTGEMQVGSGTGRGCIIIRDSDNAGNTEIYALNGAVFANIDTNGLCDGI